MTFPVANIALDEIPVTDARAWRDAVHAKLRDGDRIVTAFARSAGEHEVFLTAVMQQTSGRLDVLRGRGERERGYHALTEEHPAMHCFEREMHEQTGVVIAGHPWLKPLRFAGAGAIEKTAYPFYRVDGKEVHEVQVGPVHAGVIEPGAFRFMCLGEIVHHLEIHLGYQHRGAEALLLDGDATRKAPLVETIAGDTSVANASAYANAIESLAGAKPSVERNFVRAFGLELERVAMHLAGLAGLATDIGFLQGASTYGRLRTTAINTTMRLCGSRFGRTWVRPGAQRVRVDRALAETVAANLALLQRDIAIVNDRFLDSVTVRHRFRDTGVVTTKQALEIGLVGMAARASGVAVDQRVASAPHVSAPQPRPLSADGEGNGVRLVTETGGDCWARMMVRVREIDASLAWLTRGVERLCDVAPTREPIGSLASRRLVVSLVEGWRGEVVHALETNSDGTLAHYKVQDPSLRNWFGLALALRENEISDFPICNKSFDLSYCGNDL